jgi:cardiolipin synthase
MPDGYARARGADIVNLPNIITFARLCAVPVAIWLTLRNQFALTFAIFAAAGVSDAIDGWLARRRGGTAVGAMLDPLADKALLVSMFVTLAIVRVLPDWLAILAVFRDLVIIGGLLIMWQLAMPVRIRPLLISKLNTALQIVLIGTALFLRGFELGAEPVLIVLVWAVAATTLLSGAAYVWKAARGTFR